MIRLLEAGSLFIQEISVAHHTLKGGVPIESPRAVYDLSPARLISELILSQCERNPL